MNLQDLCPNDSPPEPTLDAWGDFRYSGLSQSKDIGGENDDLWLCRQSAEYLTLAVVDVASRKRGIGGGEIQKLIAEVFDESSSNACPAETIATAHDRLSAHLYTRQALGAACLLIARIDSQGGCLWAHAGDAALLKWRPARRWARARLQLLNTRQRVGSGLLQSVGMQKRATPHVEEGFVRLGAGDMLLLASDGIYHDKLPLSRLAATVRLYSKQRDLALLTDFVRKVDTEARLLQPHADDRTLVAIEAVRPRTRNHN